MLVQALACRIGYAGGTCTIADGRAIAARIRRGTDVVTGPDVESYHAALRRLLDVPYVYTYGAGRMACYALLDAMNLRDGDEIIMPGYNCVVIPNAIRFAGLVPIYVDIRETDYNIDVDRIERAITPRTKAIVVQHSFGIPADMDALMEIARRTGLPLIEDCAHALGATLDGRQLGTIGYAGFYSTEATKMFSTEKGGILATADRDLASKLDAAYDKTPFRPEAYERAMARRFALRAVIGNRWLNAALAPAYLADSLSGIRWFWKVLNYDRDDYAAELHGERSNPYPCRLGNLMAYAGTRQLERFAADLQRRQRLVEALESILPAKGARLPVYDKQRARPSWVRFPFLVDDRDAWMSRITRLGIEPGTWLNDPIHPVGSNCDFVMYRRGSCPVAERVARTILNVPLHGRMPLSRVRRFERLPDVDR